MWFMYIVDYTYRYCKVSIIDLGCVNHVYSFILSISKIYTYNLYNIVYDCDKKTSVDTKKSNVIKFEITLRNELRHIANVC